MSKEITKEQLEQLNEAFPVSDIDTRKSYPRFGMLAKDIIEESGTGKNKTMKIIESAGTFYTEEDKGEIDEDTGKKKWTKTYLGDSVDVIIAFNRKQLRLFDKSLNKFISSPIYDTKDQIIPLYLDKRQIALGVQENLQSLYPMLTEKGKKSSKLKEETILYVIYNGVTYQWNLSQSSKWSYQDYKKALNPSSVITTLNSLEETNGSNTYRKTTFTSMGLINNAQFDTVVMSQEDLHTKVDDDAQYFLSLGGSSNADKEFEALTADAVKKLN